MNFKKKYLDWLNEGISERIVGDNITELTMPFLDRHNDFTQLYIVQIDEGKFLITDYGYTVNDLQVSGIDVLSSPSRKKIFHLTLNRLGIGFNPDDHSLFVETSPKNVAFAQHRLIQAMLDINNMFMLSRPNVENIFIEDVIQFFRENDFYFSQDIQVMGKSKLEHRYDFLMNPTKTQPERFIKTLNVPEKSEIERTIFSWIDTYDIRSRGNEDKTLLIVILNDQNRAIRSELTDAFDQYEIVGMPWSERENSKHLFAS